MARSGDNEAGVDVSALGRGVYVLPGVGTVINGKVLDGDDPKQVAAYHAADLKGQEQSMEAVAARDAAIVEVVSAPADDDTDSAKEK